MKFGFRLGIPPVIPLNKISPCCCLECPVPVSVMERPPNNPPRPYLTDRKANFNVSESTSTKGSATLCRSYY